jgi:hypothetical protein
LFLFVLWYSLLVPVVLLSPVSWPFSCFYKARECRAFMLW